MRLQLKFNPQRSWSLYFAISIHRESEVHILSSRKLSIKYLFNISSWGCRLWHSSHCQWLFNRGQVSNIFCSQVARSHHIHIQSYNPLRSGMAITTANTYPKPKLLSRILSRCFREEAKGQFVRRWVFSSKDHVSWEWLIPSAQGLSYNPTVWENLLTKSSLVPWSLYCSLKWFGVNQLPLMSLPF